MLKTELQRCELINIKYNTSYQAIKSENIQDHLNMPKSVFIIHHMYNHFESKTAGMRNYSINGL